MKKLNLQLGNIKEMLTKEQMKKISGGYNDLYCFDFTCGKDCPNGCYCINWPDGSTTCSGDGPA